MPTQFRFLCKRTKLRNAAVPYIFLHFSQFSSHILKKSFSCVMAQCQNRGAVMTVPRIHLSQWRAGKILNTSFYKPISTYLVLLLPHDSIDSDTQPFAQPVSEIYFFEVVGEGFCKSQFSFSLTCIIVCENFFWPGCFFIFYRREYVLLKLSFCKFAEQGKENKMLWKTPFSVCLCINKGQFCAWNFLAVISLLKSEKTKMSSYQILLPVTAP